MADLRIVDAPEIPTEDITGEEKLPTGGSGNYSITLDSLADYTKTKKDLVDNTTVDGKVNGVRQELDAHIEDLLNPHQVTKGQIGLGSVDNTADADKPVSNSTQAAIISAISPKADKTYVDNQLTLKANKADVYTKLETYTKQESSDLVNNSISTALTPVNTSLDLAKRGVVNRYDSSLTYNSGERAVLANGDIVKSTVDGNVNDPNVNMTGWVEDKSASQVINSDGKTQQEVNDLNLYVTKNERMFGVTGTGDETVQLTAAMQSQHINLVSPVIGVGARVTTLSKNINGQGTKLNYLGTAKFIPILSQNNDGIKIRNIEIDANGNGQLNAGLIVINSSKDFVVEDVVLRNGGTPNADSPAGVNAIGVATNGYPVGDKSMGNLSRIITYNFTKAPINWTTYAEEGTLSFSRFEQNVGNGYCPAIQVNGGKRFKSVFNFVKGTEGAGTTIATVGTTPPLAAKEVLSFGNSYYDIGSLGVLNAERYAVHIAQNFGTTDTQDFVLSHEYLQNGDGMYRSTGGVSNTYLLGNISRNTGICYSLNNAIGHYFRDQILFNYNKNNLNTIGAWVMNNCSDIVIQGGKISSTGATSYLMSSTTGTNTDIRVDGVKLLNENIGILANTHYQYFRRTRIKISREFTVANNTTKSLHLSSLLSGRSVKVDLAISAVNGSNFVDGRVQVLATSTDGTTCTILNNTVVKDAKSVGANSMVVDTTGSNLRIQYTNNLGAEIKLLCEYDIYIY